MKNQENMTKKLKSKKFLGTSFVLILCISLFVSIANLLSTFVVYASLNKYSVKISEQEVSLYFLSTSKSKIKNEIDTISLDFQKDTCAGFTWKKGNYYYSIASVYENENDAHLVQNNLKTNGYKCEVFKITFDTISMNGDFSNNEKNILTNSLSIFTETYKKLYDSSISLDTTVTNETSTKLAINEIYSDFTTVFSNFNTIFSENNNKNFEIIKNGLKKANQCLSNLSTQNYVSKEQSYSSLIKYRYVEILEIYYNLINEINNL
ncbi:MAG: hypothetical protein IJ008_03245 [Clostridia bacterium]|nr:hypothetical protein [Clostridia bacterium]